jgi:predicted nucleic acid-binding protein
MDRDQIIAAVARETGVKLSSADPILAAVAINEVLLDQALAKLDRQMKSQVDRVTAASTQAVVDAKAAAELIINEAGEWAEARIKSAGEAAAASVLSTLRQETGRAERASRAATRAIWIVAAVAAVALSGMAGMMLATAR